MGTAGLTIANDKVIASFAPVRVPYPFTALFCGGYSFFTVGCRGRCPRLTRTSLKTFANLNTGLRKNYDAM